MALTVRDLMTPDPYTVGPQETVSEVVALMDAHQIRHVPVVDAEGEIVGLVSHRDVLRGALAGIDQLPMSQQQDLLTTIPVREVMIPDVETADPSQELVEIAEMILENKFGCVPVVENQSLVGILTESDFVRHVIESLDTVA